MVKVRITEAELISHIENAVKKHYSVRPVKKETELKSPTIKLKEGDVLNMVKKIIKEQYDFEYIGSDEMDKLELDLGTYNVAEEIFRLFDHKIAEWVSNPDLRVTKETNDLLAEWKDNAKNQIVRLLKAQHQKDFEGKGYDIPGY